MESTLRIDMIKKGTNSCQSILFRGKNPERPGELLWIDHEKGICENYFKEFPKIVINKRAEEILKSKKYANQILDSDLEFIKSSDTKEIEKFICRKYTANYSIKVKKFKKGLFISEKDPKPFESYFKEALMSTDLSQPFTRQIGSAEDILMWYLLREISVNTVKMNEQAIEMMVPDKYPLNYGQLLLLFQFIAFVSPDIARALEFITQPRFKSTGFPLKLTISLYLDIVAHITLKNLRLETPKEGLMNIQSSSIKLDDLDKLNNVQPISSRVEIVEEQRGITRAEESKEGTLDDMLEVIGNKPILRNFSDHCGLETRILSSIKNPASMSDKKINYSMTMLEENKVNYKKCTPSSSTAIKTSGVEKRDFKRTMTLSRPNDGSVRSGSLCLSKVNLKKRDLLRLFRFSLRTKLSILPSKVRDVDISLID